MSEYPRLSGEETIMGKIYPTHITIPLDEYSELVMMLYKLLGVRFGFVRKTRTKLDDDIWEIIDKVEDLKYKEESK